MLFPQPGLAIGRIRPALGCKGKKVLDSLPKLLFYIHTRKGKERIEQVISRIELVFYRRVSTSFLFSLFSAFVLLFCI
jgi:hypothetical protein